MDEPGAQHRMYEPRAHKHGVQGVSHEEDAPLARRARIQSPFGLPESRSTLVAHAREDTGTA